MARKHETFPNRRARSAARQREPEVLSRNHRRRCPCKLSGSFFGPILGREVTRPMTRKGDWGGKRGGYRDTAQAIGS